MLAIFPNIPWYVETLFDNFVMELKLELELELEVEVELETVVETVVERYQEQPVSRLLV